MLNIMIMMCLIKSTERCSSQNEDTSILWLLLNQTITFISASRLVYLSNKVNKVIRYVVWHCQNCYQITNFLLTHQSLSLQLPHSRNRLLHSVLASVSLRPNICSPGLRIITQLAFSKEDKMQALSCKGQ